MNIYIYIYIQENFRSEEIYGNDNKMFNKLKKIKLIRTPDG